MWSVKCGVWSVEPGVWSVECRACNATRLKCCACHEKFNSSAENLAKVLRLSHIKVFRHVCRHVRMSGSATPATQNDITTSFDTFEKEKFCSFPHRHGEARGNQRLETRHVGASKRAFRARLTSNFHTV